MQVTPWKQSRTDTKGWGTYVLPEIVTVCTRPAQVQTTQNPGIDGRSKGQLKFD